MEELGGDVTGEVVEDAERRRVVLNAEVFRDKSDLGRSTHRSGHLNLFI